MTNQTADFAEMGWSYHFQSQLGPDETDAYAGRVLSVHRDAAIVVGLDGEELRVAPRVDNDDAASQPTVGDWVLLDVTRQRISRVLDRRSLFKRRAAGRENRIQLIAANVDTLLLVSSCNQDFNPARIERYLALAREAGAEPLLVLTKADLAEAPENFAAKARAVSARLLVVTCDARDAGVAEALSPWLARGQTLALMGSSGVGKTTLINTLAGTEEATAAIREDDAKGRHTTTVRSLHRLPGGAWLIDTPGMRELQLADARDGVDQVFGDIVALEAECRFTDCQHETEPGCAVLAAIGAGDLDPARLQRFRKLRREEAFNSASVAERHAKFRALGKMYRSIQREKRDRRRDG